MSDINPFTGHSTNPEATIQREPVARTNFEDPTVNKLNELMRSEEADEFQKIADAASRTKFATGNREIDIRNYLKFRNGINSILGLLEPHD